MAKLINNLSKIINIILGDCRNIKPYQLSKQFKVKTMQDTSFVLKHLVKIPYDCRILAKNKFNYLVKSDASGLQNAKDFLVGLAKYCEQMPINMSIKSECLYMTINELSEQCKKIIKIRDKKGVDSQLIINEIESIALSLGITACDGKSIRGKLKRYSDCKWWFGKIKPIYNRSIESVMRYINVIWKGFQVYVSDRFLTLRRENKKRNEIYLKSLIALKDSNEEIELSKISGSSLSNQNNRVAELKARIAGFEKYADKFGYKADLITVTAPSRFHCVNKNGKSNVQWDESSVKTIHKYFTDLWDCVISKFHRDNIQVNGFRVVEPHHDGTPHWHFILFTKPEHRELASNIIHKYFLKDSPFEKGASEHRVVVKDLDQKKKRNFKGSYILKGIDLSPKNKSQKKLENSERMNAWGCLWGIRQFYQFGGPSVNLWREARRIAQNSKVNDNPIWQSVLNGDWCEFIEICGGLNISKGDRKIKIFKEFDETLNSYGEEKGYVISGLVIDEKLHKLKPPLWKISPKFKVT
tara:strand:+ start:1410 stop:2984 length:1575 start_codon:yes stop_codon:yes gene_type:complete